MGRVRVAAAGDEGFRNGYYCKAVLVTVNFYLLTEKSLHSIAVILVSS